MSEIVVGSISISESNGPEPRDLKMSCVSIDGIYRLRIHSRHGILETTQSVPVTLFSALLVTTLTKLLDIIERIGPKS